ncbi:hypothetical protein JW826_03850 [Candidatus Woesearchaeota archaeon]|nr:hypothetical protein [Candidatus Woesearchaeota archaeon]
MSLYIHQLKDLTPKSADIESVFIIRDLKKKTPLPLDSDGVYDYFSLFFISESEKEKMEEALALIEPTIEAIKKIASLKDPDFEPINLRRVVEMLSDVPAPLTINLSYAKSISDWQEEFSRQFAPMLNKVPALRSQQERVSMNDWLNSIFLKLLRKDTMAFHYLDVVNEAQLNRMTDLYESMQNGFIFKVSLEEELKKHDFETRKRRISDEKLRLYEEIKAKVMEIKAGVDASYELNVRMMNWALIVYSYIKMMTSNK